MTTKPDSAPPTDTPPEPEKPPTDPPAPTPDPPAPDPETVAKEEGEKVPAWGEALNDKVDGLINMLGSVIPDPDAPDDTNPAPKPWHKR